MGQCTNGGTDESKADAELPAHASASPNILHMFLCLANHLVAVLLAIVQATQQGFLSLGLAPHSSALALLHHGREEKTQVQARLPALCAMPAPSTVHEQASPRRGRAGP